LVDRQQRMSSDEVKELVAAPFRSRLPKKSRSRHRAFVTPPSIMVDNLHGPRWPEVLGYPSPVEHAHVQRMLTVSTHDAIDQLTPLATPCSGAIGIRSADDNPMFRIIQAFPERGEATQHLPIAGHRRCSEIRYKHDAQQPRCWRIEVCNALAKPQQCTSRHPDPEHLAISD
jgi:hypothetical protein